MQYKTNILIFPTKLNLIKKCYIYDLNHLYSIF